MTFLLIIHFYSILTFVCHCNLCSCRWKCSFKSHNIVVDGIVKYSIDSRTLVTDALQILNHINWLVCIRIHCITYGWQLDHSAEKVQPHHRFQFEQNNTVSYLITFFDIQPNIFFLWARKFLVLGFFGCHKTWPIFVLIFDVEKMMKIFFGKKTFLREKKMFNEELKSMHSINNSILFVNWFLREHEFSFLKSKKN